MRRPAERRLGHDLRRVRIHTGAEAEHAARALLARAFTHGEHIAFGAGAYAPDTAAGRRLLHHELAHVVQQATGVHRSDGAAAEADAERRAAENARHGPRPLPAITAPLVQRYPVPSELPCREVVDWLNANSPYAPEWAETRCTYSATGGIRTSSRTLRDGRTEVRARGHARIVVTADCPTDRPTWTPTPRPRLRAEQQAWRAMRATLDAHEARHRRIGAAWRLVLQNRYRGLDFTVVDADPAAAADAATAEVERREAQWQADAQAAQAAIDPFRSARLQCPREARP